MIYKNIANLCRQHGISIAKLEKELGIGNGTIGKWSKSSPTVDRIKKVADHFGVTVDALIAGTDLPNTSEMPAAEGME